MNLPTQHRRSIRLQGYDYSQAGAYYITIVTQHREYFFGEITNGEMKLNSLGQFARQCWDAIPDHHSHAGLDEFIVMPNHIHGILVISPDARGGVQLNAPSLNAPPLTRDPNNPFSMLSPHKHSLGVILRTYKAAVTTACRGIERSDFAWQRNYYDHIIRNDRDLDRIREYIFNNPFNWLTDTENPPKSL